MKHLMNAVLTGKYGMDVTWDGSKQMIKAYGNGMDIRLKLGNAGILINGVRFEMDAAPLSVSGRTLVPLRAVSQALGVDVKWDGKTKSVHLRGRMERAPILIPKIPILASQRR